MQAGTRLRWMKVILLLGSTLLGLVALEFFLRAAAPRYRYAAESLFERDSERIWSRRPNQSYTRQHPDTGTPHWVINNNLALHQHRWIDPVKRAGEIRIGFFGDSMTENLRIPGPLGFSEVLDYLLNLHAGRYTVLNFGVDGYGTDQSYLYYRDSTAARGLDHVFYVFVWNDMMNLYENDLFELTAGGKLRQKLARTSPWWVRAVSGFHVTYLFMDLEQRVFPNEPPAFDPGLPTDTPALLRRRQAHKSWASRHLDATARQLIADSLGNSESTRLRPYAELLQRIVGRWRNGVEAEDGEFHVVLSPARLHTDYAFLFDGYDVIDLESRFGEFPIGLSWKFEKDHHWNELGNQLAAILLFRALEQSLGLAPLADASVEEALYRYYHAFDLDWKPSLWARAVPLNPQESREIAERYAGLEPASVQAK